MLRGHEWVNRRRSQQTRWKMIQCESARRLSWNGLYTFSIHSSLQNKVSIKKDIMVLVNQVEREMERNRCCLADL